MFLFTYPNPSKNSKCLHITSVYHYHFHHNWLLANKLPFSSFECLDVALQNKIKTIIHGMEFNCSVCASPNCYCYLPLNGFPERVFLVIRREDVFHNCFPFAHFPFDDMLQIHIHKIIFYSLRLLLSPAMLIETVHNMQPLCFKLCALPCCRITCFDIISHFSSFNKLSIQT